MKKKLNVKLKIDKDDFKKKLNIKDGVDGKTPTKTELLEIITPLIPQPRSGKDADENAIIKKVIKNIQLPKDGKDGTNGSPDTGLEIAKKVNEYEKIVDWKVLKNIPNLLERKDLQNRNMIVANGGMNGSNSSGTSGNTFVAQTPDNGTYGLLAGTVNGSNALFTVPQGVYISGTLTVYRNGILQTQGATEDFVETTPGSGTFTFNTAPPSGNVITAVYATSLATTGTFQAGTNVTITGLGTSGSPYIINATAGTPAITVVNTSSLFSTGLTGTGSGSTAQQSIFLGEDAGNAATNAYASNFIGIQAGSGATNVDNANFFGVAAGGLATDADNSNFFGQNTGVSATGAHNSNFFGTGAGNSATNASRSNFFGTAAGASFIGNNLGANNIIIGTNISLVNATANAINIGGVLFGKNTFSTTGGNPSITAVSNGSIGVGVVPASITARLHLSAGTATASTAPLKFTSGTNLTTTEAGAVEYDGTHLYFSATAAGTRYQLDQVGTANNVARWVTNTQLGIGIIADDGIGTNITAGTLPASRRALIVSATLTDDAALQYGHYIGVTTNSSGGGLGRQFGANLDLNAGYTGAFATVGYQISNNVSGTGTGVFNAFTYGNTAINANCSGTTTGTNMGVRAIAVGGNVNYGGFLRSTTAKASATNVGLAGYAYNSGASAYQIGGIFVISTAETLTFESAALIADNSIETAPIFLARDNNVKVWQILDGGNTQWTDAVNMVFGTTTGTKIGTATSQKISLWNATPIVQPTTAVAAATFVANTSAIVDDTATFDGYTIGQVVKALRNIGALA